MSSGTPISGTISMNDRIVFRMLVSFCLDRTEEEQSRGHPLTIARKVRLARGLREHRVYASSNLSEPNMADATPTPTTPTPATPPTITYDDFAKIDLRVATVRECQLHPNADKLLVLQIDVGGERRQICAGIRQSYQPEQLIGKQIIIVANLEPRPLRGQISQGMLLAATDTATGRIVLLAPAEAVATGSKVK